MAEKDFEQEMDKLTSSMLRQMATDIRNNLRTENIEDHNIDFQITTGRFTFGFRIDKGPKELLILPSSTNDLLITCLQNFVDLWKEKEYDQEHEDSHHTSTGIYVHLLVEGCEAELSNPAIIQKEIDKLKVFLSEAVKREDYEAAAGLNRKINNYQSKIKSQEQ